MRAGRWIAVIVVVIMLIMAYFAVFGWSNPVSDFNQPSDGDSDGDGIPDSEDDDPGAPATYDWDYYATFDITCRAYWITTLLTSCKISQITPDVQPFKDMAAGRVYENADLLRGHGGHQDAYGSFWLEVIVSGSNGFEATWQSDKWHVFEAHTSINPLLVGFTTGRVFFENPGSYAVLVRPWTAGMDGVANVYLGNTMYQTFEVG